MAWDNRKYYYLEMTMRGKCPHRFLAISFLLIFITLSFASTLFGEEERPSYVELGDAAFEAGKFEEAVDFYTKRLDEMEGSSGRAIVLNRRGRAYLSQMRYDDALTDLDRAVALSPGYKDAYYIRALVLLDLGRYSDAVRDTESAIKIDPSVPEYHILMGTLRNIEGDYKEALNDFDKALKLVRESPEAYCGRGFAFLGLVQYDFAGRDFRTAAKLAPSFAPAHRGMAMVYLKGEEEGDDRTALAYAEKAVKIDRNYGNLDTVAAARNKAGMIDSAAKVQREAIEKLKEEGTPGEKTRFGKAYEERLKLYEGESATEEE